MGQYREWLLYRDIDQKLQTHIAHLEQQIEQLQGQAQNLSDQSQLAENFIFRAIDKLLHPSPHAAYSSSQEASSQEEQKNGPVPPRPSFSKPSALFGMSLLPELDMALREPSIKPTTLAPLAPTAPEQPTDKITPVKRKTPIPPRLSLTSQQRADWPRDQQSMRTNQVIERWAERWSRHEEENGIQGDGSDA